jgi:hypothetical protein
MNMDKRVKIVVDDAIPFIQGVLEPYADVLYRPGNGDLPRGCR